METTFDNCNNTDLNNPVQNLLQNANTEFTSEKKTHEIFKADNPFNDGLNNFMQISDTNNKMNTNLNCDEELEHRDLPKSEQLFNFGDDEFEQKINEKRHFDGDLGPETSVDVPDEIMATESSEENLSKSSLSHSKDVLPLSENLNPFDPKNSFTDFDTNEFHVQDDTKTCTSLSENLLDTPVDQASLDDAKNMLPADCIHTNGIHTEDSTPEDVMGQDHLPSFDDHGMGVSDDGKDHFIDNEFEDNRDKDTIEAFDQHFGEQHEFREEQENNIKSEEFSLEDAKKFDDFCVEKDQKDIVENNIINESQDLFENKNVFELNPPGLQNQPEYLEYESGTEENENDSPNVGPPLEDNNFIDYNAIVEDQKKEQEIHLQDQVPDVDLVGEKDIEDSLAFKENEIDHSDTQFGCLDETIEMNSEIQPISQDMLFSSEVIDRKEHPEQETELNSLATVEENIEVQLGVEEVEEAVEEPEIIKEVQQLESNIVDSNVQEASCFDNMEMDIKPETPSQDPARESTAAESCEESEDEWNYMRLKGEGQKEVSKIPEIEEQPTSPVVLENDKVIVENSEFIDQKFEETESKEAIITSVEESSKESLPSVEHSTDNLEISETLLDNSDNEPEDMSSQLNPEAKEFIPINASPVHFELSNGIPPNKAALITKDDVVAQSPRKGLISMDDIQVPSEVEFGNEIAHCPSEMQYSPDFVHNDLYQEMNLKEAMHGSEKEEPAVEDNFPYDGPKNLDNVGMKESIYIEQTENLMNTVQPIPTNLDDVDDFLQNDSIVANASITETMEKLNLSAEIEFDSFAQSTFNEITESLKQMGKVEPTEAQTIELLSNVEQEFPVEKVIPSSEVTAPSSEVITPSPEVIAPSPEVVTPSAEVVSPSPEVVTPSPEVIAPTPEVRMEFDPVQAAVVPELKTVTEVLEPLAVKSNELIEVTASPVVEQLPAEPSPKVESTIEQKEEEKKITEKTVSKVEATKSATKVLDAKKDIKPKTTTSTTSKRVGSNTSTLSSDTTKLRASQGTAAKPKTTPTASRPRTVPSATKPLAEKKTSTSSTSVAAARPKVDSKTSLSAATRKPAASTGSRPTKPDEQPKVGVKQSASKTGVAAKPSVSATRTLSGTTPATKTRPATATANTTATKPASQRVPLSVPAKSASTSKTSAMSPRSTLTSTMRKTEAIKSPVGTKKLSATKTTTTTQTSLATKSKPSTPNTKTPTTPNSTLNAKKLPLTPSPRPIQKRTPIKKPTTTAVKKVSDENNKTQDTTIDIKLNGTAIIETVNNKTELIE